jgi:hypothetical protein
MKTRQEELFELYKKFAKHLYKKGYIDGINFEKQEQGIEEDEITEEEFDTWGVSDSIDDAVEELFNQIKGEIFYE